MIRQKIKKLLSEKVKGEVIVDSNPVFGDYSTNAAKRAGLDEKELISQLGKIDDFERIEAKNGFINFYLSKKYLYSQIKELLKEKGFPLDLGKGKKVQVEFISANPTGPLTLGNGRGGFCGDVLANVLEKAGYKVEREYYVNDRGGQIEKLGETLLGKEVFYKGKYIEELKRQVKGKNPDKAGKKAADIILKKMIKPTVKKMGIEFDVWFSERKLYKKKKVEKVLKELKEKNLVYEKEGALWLRTSQFTDGKDRVLKKSNKEETYLASDAAYFKDKMERKFDLVINFWGADHHGYVERYKSMVQALGYSEKTWHVILMQLVKLFKEGKEMRMSKREGVFTTLDELIDEVGVDVSRFFFLMRNYNSHLNFDLDLAKEKSEKNPVFYVQYAYARIFSILKKSKSRFNSEKLELLKEPQEIALMKKIIKLPEVLEDICSDFQVHRLTLYSRELASLFHQFYTECRVLGEKELTEARLALVESTKIALKTVLDIMGISSPEKM